MPANRRHRWIVAAFLASVCLDAGAAETCSLEAVANAGVLFRSGEQAFLFDAPFRDGVAPYETPSVRQRQRLESAAPPYARLAAILITHWHADHFDAAAVASHLRHDPRTVLIASGEVIDRVRSAGASARQLRELTPAQGKTLSADIAGTRVHAIRLRHNPARRTPEQHLGFLVEGCADVLHVGDANPDADNFSALRNLPKADAALLPYWYLENAPSLAFVRDAIAPARIVPVHIPPTERAAVAQAQRSVPQAALLPAAGGALPLR